MCKYTKICRCIRYVKQNWRDFYEDGLNRKRLQQNFDFLNVIPIKLFVYISSLIVLCTCQLRALDDSVCDRDRTYPTQHPEWILFSRNRWLCMPSSLSPQNNCSKRKRDFPNNVCQFSSRWECFWNSWGLVRMRKCLLLNRR